MLLSHHNCTSRDKFKKGSRKALDSPSKILGADSSCIIERTSEKQKPVLLNGYIILTFVRPNIPENNSSLTIFSKILDLHLSISVS